MGNCSKVEQHNEKSGNTSKSKKGSFQYILSVIIYGMETLTVKDASGKKILKEQLRKEQKSMML